jgi:ATP phosphoribosyltransferase regulatory subunit
MIVSEGVLKQDEKAIFQLRSLYRAYGYSPFKMSKFEEYDLYVRNKSFLVSDDIITFTDKSGRLMALKPDVTLSIVKNSKDAGGVQKVYYNENVYRVPGGGQSFREIMQVGLECLGDIDVYCLSEVVLLAAQSLAQISSDYMLEVSHMGILAAVIDRLGLSAEAKEQVLRCVDAKNRQGVEELCAAEGVDGSVLSALVGGYGRPDRVLPLLRSVLPDSDQAMVNELETVLSAVPQENLRIDFSVLQDARYYNGIVFKGFVNGIPTRILSGGQYDYLLQRMGKKAGAIGFAVYLDLLEELSDGPEAYDLDAVILYDEGTDPALLAREVRRQTERGRRVCAMRSVPEKQTWRQLLRMTESGVQEV